jgi:phosphoglycerate dehydrogenase-like enzyme
MFTIWSNTKLPEAERVMLVRECSPHRVIFSANATGNLAAGKPDPLLAQADIAFGQPDPGQIMELPNLRWIHLSSAGYARYDRADIREALKKRGAMITNSSAVFSEPCAQHALAFMLAGARKLPEAFANQMTNRAWPASELRMQSRLLCDQTVLILGFGSIARRLVELLTPLRMKMIAVRKAPRGDEGIEVHGISELDGLLPGADHVMDILPDSASTKGFVSAARFGLLKTGAVFYNIGRGNTIDQNALLLSLQSRRISAYLDVTEPEPLPADHPLWAAPNCHITPHTAGGNDREFAIGVRVFVENLRRFERGEKLRDRVI